MPFRLCIVLLALSLSASTTAPAQNRVRTETIRPSQATPPAPATTPSTPADRDGSADPAPGPRAAARAMRPGAPAPGTSPEIITNLSRLPSAVARTRERILHAARSGDLRQVVALMRGSNAMPLFSPSDDKDPLAYWKATYPDSEGLEILSILITVLETGFVHLDRGTPQEVYLWPYFARTPLKTLTPQQKVELFKIVTGSDYHDMLEFGAHMFYRAGIGPDGTWQFFVSGD